MFTGRLFFKFSRFIFGLFRGFCFFPTKGRLSVFVVVAVLAVVLLGVGGSSFASLLEELEREVSISGVFADDEAVQRIVCESSIPAGKWQDGRCLMKSSTVNLSSFLVSSDLCELIGCRNIGDRCICEFETLTSNLNESNYFDALLYDVKLEFWRTWDGEFLLTVHGLFYPRTSPPGFSIAHEPEFEPGWFVTVFRISPYNSSLVPYKGFILPAYGEARAYDPRRGYVTKQFYFFDISTRYTRDGSASPYVVKNDVFWLVNRDYIHMTPVTDVTIVNNNKTVEGYWFSDVLIQTETPTAEELKADYEPSLYYTYIREKVGRRVYYNKQTVRREQENLLPYGVVAKAVTTEETKRGRTSKWTNFCFNGICSKFFKGVDEYRYYPLGYRKVFLYIKIDGSYDAGILFDNGALNYYRASRQLTSSLSQIGEEKIAVNGTPLIFQKASLQLSDGTFVTYRTDSDGQYVLERAQCNSNRCLFESVELGNFVNENGEILSPKAVAVGNDVLYVGFVNLAGKKVYVDVWNEDVIFNLFSSLEITGELKDITPQVDFYPADVGFENTEHETLYNQKLTYSNPSAVTAYENVLPRVDRGDITSLFVPGKINWSSCLTRSLNPAYYVCGWNEEITGAKIWDCRVECLRPVQEVTCQVVQKPNGVGLKLVCPVKSMTFYYKDNGELTLPFKDGKLILLPEWDTNLAKAYISDFQNHTNTGRVSTHWRCKWIQIDSDPNSRYGDLLSFTCKEGLENSGITGPMELPAIVVSPETCFFRSKYYECRVNGGVFYYEDECKQNCYSFDEESLIQVK